MLRVSGFEPYGFESRHLKYAALFCCILALLTINRSIIQDLKDTSEIVIHISIDDDSANIT